MATKKKEAAPSGNLATVHPAESTGILGSIATGVAALLGAGTETVAIIGVVAGALAAAVTFLNIKGVVPTVRRFLFGPRGDV